MKKKILIIMNTAIFTIGAMTAVYAKENNNINRIGFGRGMINQNNFSTS